jgi:hypothetical protein
MTWLCAVCAGLGNLLGSGPEPSNHAAGDTALQGGTRFDGGSANGVADASSG